MTNFEDIYKIFLSKITDDMYIFLQKHETISILQEMLLNSLCSFVYPNFDIEDYIIVEPTFSEEVVEQEDGTKILEKEISDESYFQADLTLLEKHIIAELMVVEWVGQQLANKDLCSQLYTGSDSRKDSQANHMAKLQSLQKHFQEKSEISQFNYSKFYKDTDGLKKSNFGDLCRTTGGGKNEKDPYFSFKKF